MTYRHDDTTYTNAHMGEGKADLTSNILNALEREVKRRRRERIVETIGSVLITAILGLMFAWVGINWVTGCGETFITYTGERIAGECVLMPWRD
jgi:hypothetical protein